MIQHSRHRTLAIWLTLLGFVMASGATRRSGGCCVTLGTALPVAASVAADDASPTTPKHVCGELVCGVDRINPIIVDFHPAGAGKLDRCPGRGE